MIHLSVYFFYWFSSATTYISPFSLQEIPHNEMFPAFFALQSESWFPRTRIEVFIHERGDVITIIARKKGRKVIFPFYSIPLEDGENNNLYTQVT